MKRSKRKPEEWRDIKGWEGLYQVSSHGRVKSLERIIECSNGAIKKRRERILKGKPHHIDGYPRVQLIKGDFKKNKPIHRLVAEAFIPNTENKPTVDHKYGEKINNYFEDLRWGTHQEQMDWAWGEQGLKREICSGEGHWSTTLTNDQVEEIIRLLQKGNNNGSISKQYNIAASTVTQINKGRFWTHISPEVPRPIVIFQKNKLTTEEVEEIINEIQNTNKTIEAIAEQYNVLKQSVSHINTGKSYKEVLPHIQRPIRSKTNKSNREDNNIK